MVYTIRKEKTCVLSRKRKRSNSERAEDLFVTISSNKLKAESLLDDYKNLDLDAIIRCQFVDPRDGDGNHPHHDQGLHHNGSCAQQAVGEPEA